MPTQNRSTRGVFIFYQTGFKTLIFCDHPPHTRGKHIVVFGGLRNQRITPAYAGKTETAAFVHTLL